MKNENTSIRLKKIMNEKNLRQIDILNKTLPYCKEYGIKMNRSDLSQYVSGKVLPNQYKLTVLGMALDVSEAWLMGLDVPRERIENTQYKKIQPYQKTPQNELLNSFNSLDNENQKKVISYTNNLKGIQDAESNISNIQKPKIYLNASHSIEGASEEDKRHDDEIMNDKNF